MTFIVPNSATPGTPSSGRSEIFVNTGKLLSQVDDTGLVRVVLFQPAVYQASPGDPTGTTDLTGKMMGLAGAITPVQTGRLNIEITGYVTTSGTTATNGAQLRARYGTGSAPTNGAALTGTTVGSLALWMPGSTLGTIKSPFQVGGIVTGLTVNTAVWLDIELAAIVAGTASIKDVSITAFEL